MFDSLAKRFDSVFQKLRGKGLLSEADVDAALRESWRVIFLLIFSFSLIFSVCGRAYALDLGNHSIRDAASGKKVACPARDFSEFIKAFSENTEVQMAFTKYPLKEQSLGIDAEPEPKPVVRKLRRDQVSFPVIHNEAERKKQLLELRVDSVIGSNAEVTLFKDNTGYLVTYEFEFDREGCWYLLSVNDQSM
jgi:hypothetical protein